MAHLHARLQLLSGLLRFQGLLACPGAPGLRRADLRGGGRLTLRPSLRQLRRRLGRVLGTPACDASRRSPQR